MQGGVQRFREILLRVMDILKEKAAHSETVKLVKELARAHLRLLARRISVLSPLVHKALKNRLAIAFLRFTINPRWSSPGSACRGCRQT